jgi:hypothetical protein
MRRLQGVIGVEPKGEITGFSNGWHRMGFLLPVFYRNISKGCIHDGEGI